MKTGVFPMRLLKNQTPVFMQS